MVLTSCLIFLHFDRTSAIKAFKKAGFIHTDLEYKVSVFDKKSIAKQLLITKEMYFSKKESDQK